MHVVPRLLIREVARFRQPCLPQNNDGDQQQVQMACSLAQMQDLVSKLKDASKKLELMKDPNA